MTEDLNAAAALVREANDRVSRATEAAHKAEDDRQIAIRHYYVVKSAFDKMANEAQGFLSSIIFDLKRDQ